MSLQEAGRRKLEDERHCRPILPRCGRSPGRRRAIREVDGALCLPATLIERAVRAVPGFAIGGQDVHPAASGAHTGCISAAMLLDAGATLTIVGHSERREAQHESDADVRAKAEAALAAGSRSSCASAKAMRCAKPGDAVATCQRPARRLAARDAIGARPTLPSPMSRSGRSAPARSRPMADIGEMHAALRAAAGRGLWRGRERGADSLRRLGQGLERGRDFRGRRCRWRAGRRRQPQAPPISCRSSRRPLKARPEREFSVQKRQWNLINIIQRKDDMTCLFQ